MKPFYKAARRWLSLLALIGLAGLAGCAVNSNDIIVIEAAPNPKLLTQWQRHQARAAQIQNWRIDAKLAVKAGNKGGHASMRWHRDGATEHLEIFGPLGGGRVVIDSDANGARLKDTNGKILHGAEIESLLQQRLIWPLPFNNLASWVRGLPASDTQALQFNAAGALSSMNDGDWQVRFVEYQPVALQSLAIKSTQNKSTSAGQINLPRVIELNALPGTLKIYDDQGAYLGEDLFVRLIIKNWQ